MPIVVVDFSMANLIFDEKGQWTGTLHSLKDDNNDYTDCLHSVQNAFSQWDKNAIGLGLGGKTYNSKHGNASNLFSMTGDITKPIISDYVGAYKKTLQSVQLALPLLY